MWPPDQAWRAPVGDFPPPWASAWGDDPYGLWADLTVNGITQRMRWIEPSGPEGFWMGSTEEERSAIEDEEVRGWAHRSESEPQLIVIAQGFWLADTPCTREFWQAVIGAKGRRLKHWRNSTERFWERVSFDEVEQFILRFATTPEWGCDGRLGLPTEAQWEYAARAGSTTAYWWGDDPNSAMASWNGEQQGATEVKHFQPNAWGLFDVHGGVWEWCDDFWRQSLDVPQERTVLDARVVRGGSRFAHSSSARSATRYRRNPGARHIGQGFRFCIEYSGDQLAQMQKGMTPGGAAGWTAGFQLG